MKNILLILVILFGSKCWAQTICPSEFIITSPNPCPGVAVSISVSAPSGYFYTVAWEFADGGTASGHSISHTFSSVPGQGAGPYATATILYKEPSASIFEFKTCTRDLHSTIPCIFIDIPDLPPIPPGNPFVNGEEGNWRLKRTWVLQTERKQTRTGVNDNLNLRVDGTYKNFDAFWNPTTVSGDFWLKQNEDKWTFKTQINHYNPFGSFELENVDPLSKYSSAVYGYNHTLPIGIASNARYREIAFDGFEDYDFGKCANNHFSFQFTSGIENKIKESTSHSGRRSIRLNAGETLTMQKEFAECPEEDRPIVVK